LLDEKPQTERKLANHQLMMPPVKPNCTETNLPFDSALRVRTNHPSMPPDRTSDTTLPSGENFEPLPASEKESMAHASQVGDGEKNGFVTGTTVTKEPAIATLMDNDCLESHEAGDFTTAVLADKGKRVDPREHGGTALNPNSTIVLADIDLSDIIKLIDAHRDKGKNVDPKERGDGAKYEPGPSRIDFPEYDSESAFQKQGIPLQSLEPTKTSDLNHEPLYESTPPRLSWHPKISPYRFIVFSIPLAVGTAKAISSQKGNVTVPITLEWISGVVVFLV
jgi:hypothetical protein